MSRPPSAAYARAPGPDLPAPTPELGLLALLRQRTGIAHARLDADLRAGGALHEPAAAARMLVATALVLGPLEAVADLRLGLATRPGSGLEPALAADLRRMANSPDAPAIPPVALDGMRWLGAVYVAEGTALGTPTVQRELRASGLGPSAVLARLDDPLQTRRRWAAVVRALAAVDDGAAREQVCTAAAAVFAAYRQVALEAAR